MTLGVKALALWLLLAVMAVGNGLLREHLLLTLFGQRTALPLSGITLSVFIFLATYLTLPFIGRTNGRTYLGIGALWVLLTLIFEFGFGYFVAGKPLTETLQVFNIRQGDLFLLVLLVTAAAPHASARLHGYL